MKTTINSRTSTRPLRVATLCHSDDDYRDPGHRRVRIELHRDGAGYVWRLSDGTDTGMGASRTIGDAEVSALRIWGADVWALRARWVP